MSTPVARDVMTCGGPVVQADTPLARVAREMVTHGVRAVPVVDADRTVIGVVSESDLLARAASLRTGPRRPRWRRRSARVTLSAGEVMTAPAATLLASAAMDEVTRTMVDRDVRQAPVVDDDGVLLGMLTRADVLKTFVRDDDEIKHEIVAGVVAGQFSLSPLAVDVTVRDGVATLSGFVDHAAVAALLAEAVRKVAGVVAVRTLLTWRREDAPRGVGPFDVELYPWKLSGRPSSR